MSILKKLLLKISKVLPITYLSLHNKGKNTHMNVFFTKCDINDRRKLSRKITQIYCEIEEMKNLKS